MMPAPSVAVSPALPLPVVLLVGASLTLTACGPAGGLRRLVPWSSPTPTASPTGTASPTATASPSPTAHPLQIRYLQERPFAAEAPVVLQTLEPGRNYARYVVSYLSDGLRIQALMTQPDGEVPPGGWPLVMFNHGYIPPAQYRTTERYVAYVDAFARAGYMVLKSDYRGHGDSEGEARGGYGSPDYTIDVLNGLAAMRQLPQVDGDRVGMWGHSMGGWITLRSMVVTDSIKAGVIWAGVVGSFPDLYQRWRRPSQPTPLATRPGSWRSTLVQRFGSPEENPAFWDSLSANRFLDRLAGPIQLHHGTADADVPLLFSEILAEDLKEAGRPGELFVYPGDDHNLSANLGLALRRSVAFFDQHVKGAATALP